MRELHSIEQDDPWLENHGDPDIQMPIPRQEDDEEDSFTMLVWYDRERNRTYSTVAGGFMNQDTYWSEGIVPIEALVQEYVDECQGG